uniref:SSD domain-containing protein n=1 Tax=Globodera rostochiensis TaxID=31243 RepID=A0A914GUF8_GLORO
MNAIKVHHQKINSASIFTDSISLDALGGGVRGLLGGLTFDPETRRIAGVKALMLPYALRHGTDEQDLLAEKWELKLAQFLNQFYSPHIRANWWTYETLAAESAHDQRRLQFWLLPCFVTVSLFSMLLCCCSSPVFSRPLLALSGVLSVALAISSGTGFLLLLGFPVTSVVLAMPFIIFSVGVDNVFILLAVWRSTPALMSFEQRMARTFGDAGVSITITFLTDFLSFSVGCLAPFPSVQMFCLFCAVALLFSYVHQMTLFAALMSLTCLREVQQRHCLTIRKMSVQNAKVRTSVYAIGRERGYNDPRPTYNLALSRLFRSHYTPFLLNKFNQSLVLLLFGFYLLISAYGCLNIEIGLEPLDLLPENSYGKRALIEAERYFPDNGGHLHVWIHNLSRVHLGHRRLWLVLEKELELYEHTEFTGAADSWLRSFLHFQHTEGMFTTNANFVPRLHKFLKMNEHRKYRRDIRFTSDGCMLEASRVPVRLRFVGFQNQSRAMHLFRLLAESSELPTGVYADFFLFAEQYDSLLPGTVSSIAVAGLAVVVVSLLLIPEPVSALWVSFSIVSINLGILGLMPFLSIRLDFISMVTIVMSIGLCVDFSAHLAYNYSREDKDHDDHQTQKDFNTPPIRRRKSPVEKMGNALYAVGTPICQSAGTSILGVSFLAYTESYIFRSFFKTTVLVISLGVLHGLVILPVLLTVAQRNGGDERGKDGKEWTMGDNRLTATEISAPIQCHPVFVCSIPTLGQSPFGLTLARTDKGTNFVREASPYSTSSTLTMGREQQR